MSEKNIVKHTKGKDLVRINTNMHIYNGEDIINLGKKLVDTNDFFKDIMELMEIPKFRSFLEKHFHEPSEIKNSTMYIKLYESLEKQFILKNPDYPVDKSKYIITYCLFNMMSEQDYRKKIINLTSEYLNDKISNTNDNVLYNQLKQLNK